MDYIKVAPINKIPIGTMKSFLVSGKQILISNIEGTIYAINNTCTHQGGDLSKGKLEGKIATCPNHGAKFDVTTGKNISGARMGLLKIKIRDEMTYEVKVVDNKILISMG